MDRIYNCLDIQQLTDMSKALYIARYIISREYGDNVIQSTQYIELVSVLHDVEARLAEIYIDDVKKLENKVLINRYFNEKDNK